MKKPKRIMALIIPSCITLVCSYLFFQYLRNFDPSILSYSDKTAILLTISTTAFLTLSFYAKYRKYAGIEHGSSHWSKRSDLKPFRDKKFQNTIILSQTEQISIDQKKTRLADHVLVLGDTGAGKSRFYAKPNIMQMNGSYVITDPSGEHLYSEGAMLAAAGYKIKVFDVISPSNSLHFNPFHYYKTPVDVQKFIEMLILNTSGDKSNPQSMEDFWVKSERLWLSAHINYILETCPPEEQNIESVMKLLHASEVKDEDEDFVSAVDILFHKLEEQNPQSFACKQYKGFKLAAGKTAKSILISVDIRLQHFDIQEYSDLFSEDELGLEKIGQEKTALFLVMDETDRTFNYMIAILFSVLFNTQAKVAKTLPGRELPLHLHCIIDEIANIGKFPNLENLLATMRKYNVGLELLYQDLGQIKHIYKEDYDTILSNCPIKLFLGGTGETTTKYVSEQMLGDTTITTKSTGDSGAGMSGKGNHSINEQSAGRKLLDATEISKLSMDECIVSIKGLSPFHSRKYDIKSHPNYSQLADGQKQGYLFYRSPPSKEVTIQTKYITEIKLEEN